ncbi:hypothetical protein PAMC26577_24020 [Caballeronia sordidicola]|uniref:Uncharacterized protein n=2 Tax=Caballeronia sordidicola TaxID=196367 RepID=A0A242MKN1_CABSO|nr:hypothetical protein PAMC26577_24020 [Caballeronia sordidicola]
MQKDAEVMQRIDVIGTLLQDLPVTAFSLGHLTGLMVTESSGIRFGELVHGRRFSAKWMT